MSPAAPPPVTVVIPCLNEGGTIGMVVEEVRRMFEKNSPPVEAEIIVVDNGSTDGSAASAAAAGAGVIHEPERGYGRALRAGAAAAQGCYVLFMDADGEHPAELAPALYRAVAEAGADVALASRFRGHIAPGAMPFLHRRFGTPFLTALINRLYGGRLTDCMSGLRCVRREWFMAQGFKAGGMAFASELLILALKANARIIEIPGGMKKGPAGRKSHLRTWRDGWRHLRLICGERFRRERGEEKAASRRGRSDIPELLPLMAKAGMKAEGVQSVS